MSNGMAREVVWLSGQLAYEAVSEVLKRVGGYEVPSSTVWEVCQRRGERLLAVVEKQHAQVDIERVRWEQARYAPEARKAVSMDGGMVLVRDEGWKELKVGVVANLVAPHTLDPAKADEQLQDDLHYTATLGGVAEFSSALWDLAVQHDVPYAGQVAVTADGAAWIWGIAADLFPQSTQIVDWFHAAQHIDQAVQARFPDDTQASDAKRWRDTLKNDLFQGQSWKVIDALHAAHLPDAAAYFHSHRHRMQYPVFRAAAFPIGSGSTESAVKQFKHRLCGPGMRWSRPGVQRMAVIRSAVLDASFDTLWDAA